MKLKLNINYAAQQGEWLYVNILAADGKVKQHKMNLAEGDSWKVIIEAEPMEGSHIDYFYSVQNGKQEVRREWWMTPHRLHLNSAVSVYTSYDCWFDMPEDSYLYSSAFTECVHAQTKTKTKTKTMPAKALILKVQAPQLYKDEYMTIVGSDKCVGAWDISKRKPLCQNTSLRQVQDKLGSAQAGNNEWYMVLDADKLKEDTMEFKFVAANQDPKIDSQWEEGANRTITIPEIKKGEAVVYELPRAWFANHSERLAGTAVPVFALRSNGSFGVGDFGDLKLMIDWAAKTHQRVLQVLPINDTTITHTWTDSYPYSAISIFALHPMYTDLRQLPALKDSTKAKEFEEKQMELNALAQIDYEAVNEAKNEYLHLLFEQEGKDVLASAGFKAWFKEEEQWLVPYAQYCMLRDKNGTADYSQWPDHNNWDEKDRKALTSARTKDYKAASYYYYVQFILAQQMKSAHEHARQNNVVLKGDIPIGVNRYGCDAWQEPRYFNMNGQAGAPPDDFSVNGQNWGFPTYNWDEMIADGCQWWIRRFSNMSKYFDAYRIDHVLGFFRIWEIPIHSVHGLLGQFAPALGMSPDEIRGYGLNWNEELMTTPFIMDWVLDRRFGDKANYVRETFLEKKDEAQYRLKEEFNTQRKVEAYFDDLIKNQVEVKVGEWILSEQDLIIMRDTLYSLISNVLFLRDHKNPELFHPRITAQLETCYETLWDHDKAAYNRLYNDYFYKRNNNFWYHEAMKKMPHLINATKMLVCAEDLGMVPDCVAWVMNELRILSLEIQSMPKDNTVTFGVLERNPYRSVCTISSHDTATLRMWWDEDYDRAQKYYNLVLHRGGNVPHPMPEWLAQDIITQHLACPSMLCILTLQDWLSMSERLRLPDANAERINIPANPKHYWRYRMHLNIEDLINDEEFTALLHNLINYTNR